MGLLPKFLSKNLITSTSMLTVSSGDSTKLRLIDRNTDIQWSTIAETTGTRTITVTFLASTTINRIILQGINWKAFTIKYNSGTNFSPAISATANTDTNIYLEVTSQAVTTVEFSITDTITASENVKCGELYIGTELFEMSTLTGGVSRVSPDAAQSIFRLSDGTTYKIYVRKIFGFDVEVTNINSSERANYVTLYERNKREPFYFIPEPIQPTIVSGAGSWNGVGCHVNWINPFDIDNHMNDITDNNYYGTLELRQAGGI